MVARSQTRQKNKKGPECYLYFIFGLARSHATHSGQCYGSFVCGRWIQRTRCHCVCVGVARRWASVLIDWGAFETMLLKTCALQVTATWPCRMQWAAISSTFSSVWEFLGSTWPWRRALLCRCFLVVRCLNPVCLSVFFTLTDHDCLCRTLLLHHHTLVDCVHPAGSDSPQQVEIEPAPWSCAHDCILPICVPCRSLRTQHVRLCTSARV